MKKIIKHSKRCEIMKRARNNIEGCYTCTQVNAIGNDQNVYQKLSTALCVAITQKVVKTTPARSTTVLKTSSGFVFANFFDGLGRHKSMKVTCFLKFFFYFSTSKLE